ncbi:ester cyclase [Desulfobacterota bacterium AH_259_B03_O07]|nr:ester cyclase [Desulfobacterota bacterium AH_259_B03_O07]
MEEELPLTPSQQKMVELWEKHTASEFVTKSIEDTMSTMTQEPFVNHVPAMTGGLGLDNVRKFYSKYFIPSQPPDTEIVLISRTVGTDRIVDELIHKFTHTIVMPWILPGVPPTGKRVEHAVVAVVHFKDGKIDSEHIYWDQASLLVQIGLLDSKTLPVAGVETARKLLDPSLPSNELMKHGDRS